MQAHLSSVRGRPYHLQLSHVHGHHFLKVTARRLLFLHFFKHGSMHKYIRLRATFTCLASSAFFQKHN
uniref:Uncharacterized protein n=1 Tax=Populus trichocarpa TaxID=3694 RepID=A0A2K1Y327_POPTR